MSLFSDVMIVVILCSVLVWWAVSIGLLRDAWRFDLSPEKPRPAAQTTKTAQWHVTLRPQ